MCGIAGLIDLRGNAVDTWVLKAMMDVIRHRGADDEGYVLIDQGTSRSVVYAGSDSPDVVKAALPMFGSVGTAIRPSVGLGIFRGRRLFYRC